MLPPVSIVASKMIIRTCYLLCNRPKSYAYRTTTMVMDICGLIVGRHFRRIRFAWCLGFCCQLSASSSSSFMSPVRTRKKEQSGPRCVKKPVEFKYLRRTTYQNGNENECKKIIGGCLWSVDGFNFNFKNKPLMIEGVFFEYSVIFYTCDICQAPQALADLGESQGQFSSIFIQLRRKLAK